MKIITERSSVKDAIAMYIKYKDIDLFKEGYIKIGNLNPLTSTAEQIETLLGKNNWTTVICDECGSVVRDAIEFCNPEEHGNTICFKCISEAYGSILIEKS